MTPLVWLALGLLWSLLCVWLWRRERRQGEHTSQAADLLSGGLLFLLTAAFFWRPLSGEVFQPADGGDLVSFLFPTYRFAAETLRQGELPLWNPALYGGAPLVGDIQAGFLYPPNLLLFLIHPTFDYPVLQWLSIGHIYWAALGMYVLVRTLRLRRRPLLRPAAFFAALAFAFSDPLLIHLGNLNLIAVLSWLPWTFAAYVRALDERSLRWAAAAGLLCAVGAAAGHAQSSFYVALALAVYTLLAWALQESQGFDDLASRTQRPHPFVLFLTTGLLALLLTAPILLPAFELSRYSVRADFTYQETVSFSLAPTQALAGLLTPGFFGRGPALHWSLWDRVETPFAGVATVILALAGLLAVEAGVRRRLAPWLGLALLGLLAALGVYAIVHGWLTQLPAFGAFRAPARALVLWTFGLAVAAAAGLDALASGQGRAAEPAAGRVLDSILKAGGLILAGVVTPLAFFSLLLTQGSESAFLRASVAALALVFAAVFWLATWALIVALRAGWIGARSFSLGLIALLYLDLAAAGAYTDISPSDPARTFDHPEIIAFLKADPDLFRIDTRTEIADLWQPDAALLHGLQDVGGIANPLELRPWAELWEATGGRQTSFYDMLNVEYVLVRDGTPLPEGKFDLAFDAPGALAVYRNRTAGPRAWLVHAAEVVPPGSFDARRPAALFAERTFDPRREAIVEGEEPLPLAAAAGPERVEVTTYNSTQMTIEVEASAPALLMLSEVWYPGWTATVNGVEAPVYRANGALRAVPLPAGDAVVELHFRPAAWRWGLAAAAAGFLGVLAALFYSSWGGESGIGVPGPTR